MDRNATGSVKRFSRILAIGLAIALQWFAAEARAGCGTIVTLNPTDHWAWITIYGIDDRIQMDYGWVGPHSLRKWTGGASPLPYACGSFYHVRYEVKDWTGKGEPPGGGTNIFDTRMQINPQLVLTDILQLLQSIGSVVSCVSPGVGTAACLAHFGIEEGAQTLVLGAIGSDSNNSVVCLKTSDNVNYYLENSGNCARKPPPCQPPCKRVDHYRMVPALHKLGVGFDQRTFHFQVWKNDVMLHLKQEAGGRFYSDHPDIANFPDSHSPWFHTYKAGTTQVHVDFDGKRQASATIEVVKYH